VTLKEIAQYVGKEFKRRADICIIIIEKKNVVIPRPTKPRKPVGTGLNITLTEEQEDDYVFEIDLYKQDIKSYNIR